MHWLHSNSRRVLVFTVGALIALGGIAYATIPDVSGLISACYSSTSGALRVIDSAAKCSAAERAISWNQTGPAGAQGAQGLKGDTGGIGPQGPKGDAGPNNVAGTYGDTVSFNNQANVFSGSFTGVFQGSGNGLTGLNANDIASGVISESRLPADALGGRAYMWVFSNGDFGPYSKNVRTVDRYNTGWYCVVLWSSIDPARTAPVATLVAGNGSAIGFVTVLPKGCYSQVLGSYGIEVHTYDLSGHPADHDFTIAVP